MPEKSKVQCLTTDHVCDPFQDYGRTIRAIPVRLNVKYDQHRTSEWLRRVLTEARARRVEGNLKAA